MLALTQTGLINNILETVGISYFNTRGYPTKVTSLGTDTNGPHIKEQWNYTYVIGVFMYLSSNSHPEIKFTVHQ